MGGRFSKFNCVGDLESHTIRGPYDLKDFERLPPCGGRKWKAPCELIRGSEEGCRSALFICYACLTMYRVHSECRYKPSDDEYEWPHKHIRWPELPDGWFMVF